MNTLQGKRVLIFDTETTGLPITQGWNKYHDYRELKYYDRSRIVSIGWYYTPDYRKELLPQEVKHVNESVIKPVDFSNYTTDEDVLTRIHGISYEQISKGEDLSTVITAGGLGDALLNCECIICHNCLFDIHVLLSELHRLNLDTHVQTLKDILDTKSYFCTCDYGTNICKIPHPTRWVEFKYKMPRLSELYKHYYHEEPTDTHTARGDVTALMKILVVMEPQ